MGLNIYNTLSREKEPFVPVHEGEVRMYVCGPTVYNDSHLGHGKTYVNFDTMVRYFRYLGYRVTYVQNITDVGHLLDSGEDRLLKGAEREHIQPMAVAELYTQRYFRDMDRLNVLRPDISPRATGHVPEMIAWIQSLIDTGHAYVSNGSVYFDVSSYRDYGKLSGRRIEDAQSGTRVDSREEKRAPEDFALWKRAEPEHIMRWTSPWGEGFPGWHIECTVMSTKYLGQPFDIHGGGVENKFPHHECEIAQAEAPGGKAFAKYWIHNGMLMIRGEEMHKSLGNFISLDDAFQRWDPLVIRFFVQLSHYRGPLDVTEEALDAAGKGHGRILSALRSVQRQLATAPEGEASESVNDLVARTREAFESSMNDDFNTAGAVAALFDMTREANTLLNSGSVVTRGSLEAIDRAYQQLAGDVLGVLPDKLEEAAGEGLAPQLIDMLLEARTALRQAKQWAMADAIRDRLAAMNIQVQDGADGSTWTMQ